MIDDRSRGARNAPHDDAPAKSGAGRGGLSTLSTREAAATLGLSQAVVRRAIASGELAATREGVAWRIDGDDLARFARHRNLPLPLVRRERIAALPAPHEFASALPAPRTTLIGRDAEVDRLITLLEDPEVWLVTLTGPGGVGKTRLALAAAAAMQDRLADGVVFVDLAAVTRPSNAVPAIAQALGLRELGSQDRRSQVAAFLRSRQLLLVLDNLEQIVDAAPEIAKIAQAAPGTTVLATSRAPLRVGGEREMPVPTLPLPARDAAPDELFASDAGRLFVERASARDPSFVVDAQSAPIIARICARLDGLPLAIELAAARTRLFPPRQLHDRLERTLTLLTRGDRDAPRRHLTMRDAVAWSYDLLAPAEQRLFRQLSVFSGGFTLDAVDWLEVQEVGHGSEQATPLERLDALLDQSLVIREVGADGEPRFRMLETIRAYGLERLDAAEASAFRDLHARYYRELAQTWRPMVVAESARGPQERLAADDANLRAALAWLADNESPADFGAMTAALSGYWLAYSLLTEAASWLERALAVRDQIPLPDRARILVASGILATYRGDSAGAEHAFAEALPLIRATGDAFDVAMSLTSLGALRNQQGRYSAAAALLEEGRVVADLIADPRQRAAMTGRALANLSVTARERGDFAAARSLNEAALACYQEFGFDLAETRARIDLGDIARDQGDVASMVAHYQSCLARTGERGDMRVVYEALSGIASACSAWDQPQNAVLLYGAADALRERVGLAMVLPSDAAMTERNLAVLHAALSDAEFAASWAEGRGLPLARALAIAATVAPAATEPKSAQPADPFLLTRRERDVLRLLAEGRTDRDIAEALFIGPRTVSWHVSAILSKLGVGTRREAAAKALADGLL
jgi:excisionase family DNA binding protein